MGTKKIKMELLPQCVEQAKPAGWGKWYSSVARPVEERLDLVGIEYKRVKLRWVFKKTINLATAQTLHTGLSGIASIELAPLNKALWEGTKVDKTKFDSRDDLQLAVRVLKCITSTPFALTAATAIVRALARGGLTASIAPSDDSRGYRIKVSK